MGNTMVPYMKADGAIMDTGTSLITTSSQDADAINSVSLQCSLSQNLASLAVQGRTKPASQHAVITQNVLKRDCVGAHQRRTVGRPSKAFHCAVSANPLCCKCGSGSGENRKENVVLVKRLCKGRADMAIVHAGHPRDDVLSGDKDMAAGRRVRRCRRIASRDLCHERHLLLIRTTAIHHPGNQSPCMSSSCCHCSSCKRSETTELTTFSAHCIGSRS